MEEKFNLNQEINRLELELSSKSQISTIDLALIYNLCDKYIKSKLGVDILTIFEKIDNSPLDITNFLMFSLCSEPKILNFLSKYRINEILAKTIYTMGDKKIITLTNEDIIENSNKRPHQMPIPSDENQIKRIFQALRRNYNLYEQLYKDKIWLINSTDNNGNEIGNAKLQITPYSFFHLMGFDYRNILNPNKKDKDGTKHEAQAREFSAVFPDPDKAYRLLQNFGNKKNIYELIEELLNSEERFLEAALSGNLSNTINIDKLELKSYSFERMGLVQCATGMIFFDKQKAINLGYKDEVRHINPDIILLNDFLRKYKIPNLFGLDFVISPFDKINQNQISDQQSIFLTRQEGGGFNSHLFDQQMASVSSSVAGYRENDFNYGITEQGTEGGNPSEEPIDYREFDEEDRKRVAQTMSEAIPELDQTYLNEITKGKGHQK